MLAAVCRWWMKCHFLKTHVLKFSFDILFNDDEFLRTGTYVMSCRKEGHGTNMKSYQFFFQNHHYHHYQV